MNWFQQNFRKIIYVSFLIPIILVAVVSISHVTKWYGISNPFSWAIYLSIGVEVAALAALAAISAKMGKKVYFPFGIVTLIQFIGNIFFAYQYIDINGVTFKDWVDLVDPLVSYLGVESGNMIAHKRFLALFAGGMLPLISLSFLHMLVKFEEEEKNEVQEFSTKEVEKPVIVEEFSTKEPILENIFQNNEEPEIIESEPFIEYVYEEEPQIKFNVPETVVEEKPEIEIQEPIIEHVDDDVLIEETQDSKDEHDNISLEDFEEDIDTQQEPVIEETPVEVNKEPEYPTIPEPQSPKFTPPQPKRLTYIKRV